MKSVSLHTATLVCLWFSSFAQAHPCELDVFTPGALSAEIQSTLREAGVVPIQATQASLVGISVVPGSRALLSSGAVVGRLTQTGSARYGNSQVSVFDDTGRPLFSASSILSACPAEFSGGPCYQVQVTTEIEPPMGNHVAFTLLTEGTIPGAVVRYYKYGHVVGRNSFSRGLRSSLDWLAAALLERKAQLPQKALAPMEQAYFNLLSDPDVAPYIGAIRIIQERGALVIRGRVPSNFVHGRIVDAFHRVGLWNVQPWITIDTAMITVLDAWPTLRSCAF